MYVCLYVYVDIYMYRMNNSHINNTLDHLRREERVARQRRRGEAACLPEAGVPPRPAASVVDELDLSCGGSQPASVTRGPDEPQNLSHKPNSINPIIVSERYLLCEIL